MKKILMFICMMFCFIGVRAETYYSDYGNFSEWTTNYIEKNDTTYVEEKTLYRYYHEVIEDGYYIEGENPLNMRATDDNSYYTDFTSYSTDIPIDKKNRIIETKKIYKYQKKVPIRYIKIDNIHGGYDNLRFTEIVIKDGNEKIDYTYTCDGCNESFSSHINNGIKSENWSHIQNGGSITIDLQSNYDISKLTIELSFYDVTDEYKTFNLSTYQTIGSNNLMYINIYDNFKCNDLDEYKEYIFNYYNMNKNNIPWGDIEETEQEVISSEFINVLDVVTLYRYKDKYIYYYRSSKDISDYMEQATDYYNYRTDDEIKHYRYKKRDKLVIEDNIKITSKEDDLLKYASGDNVSVTSNIDYSNNGVYKVTYTTPYISVDKDVTLDIEENKIENKYDELLNDYNELLNNYNELLDNYKTIENENKNTLEELNNLVSSYEKTKDELEASSKDNEELLNNYNILQDKLEQLNSIIADNKKSYDSLKDEYNKLLKEYEKLKKDYDKLVTTNDKNVSNYNALKEKYDELNKTYKDSLATIKKLESEIKSNTKSYQSLNKSYESLQTKYDKLNSNYTKTKEDYNEAVKEISEYKKTLKESEKDVKDITLEKDNLVKEYDKLLNKYDNMINSLDSMNASNTLTYNKMIKDMNDYKIKINELNMEIEKYKTMVNEKDDEKNKITKEYENELLNLKLSNRDLKEDAKTTNVKTLPILSIVNNYIKLLPFIFLLLILLILIVLLLHKRKKEN